eukprot:TRINITY_DN34333_c0_g1_i1.p1 TRINITY_DN34333_c0_g1~~TRINITY_DN34333_c0_g1_i1.p1  ORF type:complete len:555 (-),score=82.10 TRINITY_DN34333_c0_g1_i1:23-1687(-)
MMANVSLRPPALDATRIPFRDALEEFGDKLQLGAHTQIGKLVRDRSRDSGDGDSRFVTQEHPGGAARSALRSRGLGGTGLCGAWTSSTVDVSETCTRRLTQRYKFGVDGTAEYFREFFSWTAERACDRTDDDCDEFTHENAKGAGKVVPEGDGTLLITCPLEVCRTTGAGGRRRRGAPGDSPKIVRGTANHVLRIARAAFEEEYTKFVEVPSTAPVARPLFGRRRQERRTASAGPLPKSGTTASDDARSSNDVRASQSVCASGPSRRRNASVKQSLKEDHITKTRDLATTCIRLGDFAKARELLQSTGDVVFARRILGAALDEKIRRLGEGHDKVAELRLQIESLVESSHCATSEGNDSSSRADSLPPRIDGGCRHPSALQDAPSRQVSLGTSDIVGDSVQLFGVEIGSRAAQDDCLASGLRRVLGINRRKLEKVYEIFEQWVAADPAAAATVDEVERQGRPKRETISRDAMAVALRWHRPHMSDKDIDQVFAAADANKDGQIDRSEFVEWFFECRSLHEDVALAPRQRALGDLLPSRQAAVEPCDLLVVPYQH